MVISMENIQTGWKPIGQRCAALVTKITLAMAVHSISVRRMTARHHFIVDIATKTIAWIGAVKVFVAAVLLAMDVQMDWWIVVCADNGHYAKDVT